MTIHSALSCFLVIGMALSQDAPPTAPQEKPKKLSFKERLKQAAKDVLKDPNQQAARPQPAGQDRFPAESSASSGRGSGLKRPERNGTCTAFNWKRSTTPDPGLADALLGSGQSGLMPDPIEPAGVFELDDFGRTKTIRAVFPPLKQRERSKNSGTYYVEGRDLSAPFELELALQPNGQLYASFCDENGVYHDSGDTLIQKKSNTIHIDAGEFYKKGAILVDSPDDPSFPLACRDCYFVDKVFRSGTQQDKFLIMVDPNEGKILYYVLRIQPWPKMIIRKAVSHLCFSETDYSGCNSGNSFQKLERTLGNADERMFPGIKANGWRFRCSKPQCSSLSFDYVTPRN